MEKKVNLLTIFVIILTVLVIALGGYIVYDLTKEENKTEEKQDENNETNEEEDNNGENNDEENQNVQIEQKEINFEPVHIDEFRNAVKVNGIQLELEGHYFENFTYLGDALMFDAGYLSDGITHTYIVDETGTVLNVIYSGGKSEITETNYIKLSGTNRKNNYGVAGNKYYFKSVNFANGGECPYVVSEKDDYALEVTETIIYLGKGQFSKPVIDEQYTVGMYKKDNPNECR